MSKQLKRKRRCETCRFWGTWIGQAVCGLAPILSGMKPYTPLASYIVTEPWHCCQAWKSKIKEVS